MAGNRGRKKAMGPLPTLFVGIGPCAEKTLAEFAHVAQSLTAPIRGPFGLVLADSFCEDLFTCGWLWVSNFQVPESPLGSERSVFVGPNDEQLEALLSSLVRRLHSVEPDADPASANRIRMGSYVVIDLSNPSVTAPAIRLMRMLRTAEPAADTTVLGLTARTAATDAAGDGGWFETWTMLLKQLQDGSFAQRVYLLDGCDADKTWFEKPEQLHRLGAEFLLYHGLTCRSLLRANERARTGPHESLLNACGSFGCRTIHADRSVVARRIAERLAREDLCDLYKRTVPSGWSQGVEEQAQILVDRIAGICEKAHWAKVSPSGERRDRPSAHLTGSTEMSEAAAKTIKHICSREPLISLCLFFKCLGPKLGGLLTRQRLWERARTRQIAAEAFRQQDDNTYEPMRTWLSQPDLRWVDRFTPAQREVAHVAVGRPASRWAYLAGLLFLMIGLAGVAMGTRSHDRFAVIGGGLLSIVASVLMVLPTAWTRYPRNRLREGEEARASIPPAPYRKRPSGWIRLVSLALMVVGLAGVAWPLWPDAPSSVTTFWGVLLAVIAGVGLVFVVGCPTETRPDQASRHEAPGHVRPPVWRCRAAGLLCLALAWVIFCLWAPSPAATTTARWLAHLAGLAAAGLGIGLALFPRAGQAFLVDPVPKMPQPIAGGIARPGRETELPQEIASMAAWIDHLSLEPDQCLERSAMMDGSRDRETLFDFLAADWDSQLTQAFRQALETRSGKSLKTLALQPVLWTECITRELQGPHTVCSDLTSLFALQAVNAWLESHTFTELLSFLKIDIDRFSRLAARLAPPHWPATRVEPDMNASVIAVSRPLWNVLTQSGRLDGALQVVPLDWDSRSNAVVVVRAVQGLTHGWRGFPGMPSQPQDGASRSSEVPKTPMTQILP